MTPQQLAVRKAFYDDFRFYAQHALKVRPKDPERDGPIVPLKLNFAQEVLLQAMDRQLASEGRIRIIILKARQLGLSTVIGARLYHQISQRRATKAMVVTHNAPGTKALFEMTKRYHEHCPEILKPSTKYNSGNNLKFDVMDSGYSVATAGGESIGRGETFTHVHLSEIAFWPKSAAKTNFNGLIEAVPRGKGSEIYIESTANGMSGLFYEMWRGAVQGKNGYVPVFIPWYVDVEYREPVTEAFVRTPEEDVLVKAIAASTFFPMQLDDGQLAFRRAKIAEKGPELWNQEFPSTPTDAFLTTGRPVFNPYDLLKFGEGRVSPVRLALEGAEWAPHPRGELQVFAPFDPSDSYYIGCDVGLGVRRDWSVAQVLDGKKRQVAVWRGQVDPAYFAEVIAALGGYWGQASVIVEANNHGILTNYRLAKDLNYQPLYQDTVLDHTTDTETKRVGFQTTVKTKPMIIGQLRADFREGNVWLNDEQTLAELKSYVVTETGSMEAESGCFDDTVVALALANFIHEGAWEPIPMSDDHYADYE